MAYQNITFPAMKLIHGLTIERIAPTTVVSNFAKEYRLARFSTPKFRFRFPSRNMKYTDYTVLRDFLNGVDWEADSFNFVNPINGITYKVRLEGVPSIQIVALNSSNVPTIVAVSDISLIQVFNE